MINSCFRLSGSAQILQNQRFLKVLSILLLKHSFSVKLIIFVFKTKIICDILKPKLLIQLS